MNFDLHGTVTIPRYASFYTGKTDQYGREVRYTLMEDYSFYVESTTAILPKEKPILYNGNLERYTFSNKATGNKFEVFLMKGVGPNNDVPVYIDQDSVHVILESTDDQGFVSYKNAKIVKSLILDATYLDTACELRLNENKELEVKFGDGIHGKLLDKNTIIHLIYLRSNGPDGVVEANEVNSNDLQIKIDGFSTVDEMLNFVYGGVDLFTQNYKNLFTQSGVPRVFLRNINIFNSARSTDPVPYEDVEEIKEFAPSSFRFGNRLVTASDYRTFILDRFKNVFKDVYVCNNNEYCTLFYRWLDTYDKLDLNIRAKSYIYANACDFNNIYLFLNSKRESGMLDLDKKRVIKECNDMKLLTTTIVPMPGIRSYFMPYVLPDNGQPLSLTNKVLLSPKEYASGIVIKKANTYYSNDKIKDDIAAVIKSYFNDMQAFGSMVNLSDLQQRIYALGYVESIKTLSRETTDATATSYTKYVNGLSFVRFTQDVIEMKDQECFTHNLTLEKFQYGTLVNIDLKSIIIIVDNDDFTVRCDEF